MFKEAEGNVHKNLLKWFQRVVVRSSFERVSSSSRFACTLPILGTKFLNRAHLYNNESIETRCKAIGYTFVVKDTKDTSRFYRRFLNNIVADRVSIIVIASLKNSLGETFPFTGSSNPITYKRSFGEFLPVCSKQQRRLTTTVPAPRSLRRS